MKKLLNLIILIPFIANSFSLLFADKENDTLQIKKFIVTAYYSPLPNQQFYLRGNYEDEVILNGEGKRGASGKEVYPGMLAAPKTYNFGTKIYLDGVGIGTVDDRGGAIVGSGSRGYDGDRIDIWMGYGDSGLKRALTWGKRTVYGRILANNKEEILPSITIENFQIGKINLENLKNNVVGKNISKPKNSEVELVVPSQISKYSGSENIKYFQTIMKNLGYYNGEIDGVFSSDIYQVVLNFQLDNKVINSSQDRGASNYGPKTRQTLNNKYISYLTQEKEKQALEKKKSDELALLDSKIESVINSFGIPKENEIGNHVRQLQKTLKILGYFEGKDTAIFGEKTKESILKFQIDKGLIMTSSDLGAGMIGNKTLGKIQEDLKNAVSKDNSIIEMLEI
ncbi:MAG: peptidoglycan-binding protein [Candidatus Gracilibacteria bacterium]|nr:peptidoglycan-binding protein [Candidatus Gracilibacteria bacterium]MDD2908200.1 peptidoglycan-binding protein [Candidatus Gracilibacteria bacterium]